MRPEEKTERNHEFYKRWRMQGENIYDLLKEYGLSYPRAYQIKKRIEKKYGDLVKNLSKTVT